jgi:hypothetical protein
MSARIAEIAGIRASYKGSTFAVRVGSFRRSKKRRNLGSNLEERGVNKGQDGVGADE